MKNKGISLIVLIITIVVIIILATAIIANIANTNLIGNAKASVFKSDISNMKDELTMYITDKYTDTLGKYEPQKLQATEEGIWYGSEQQEGTITDIITSMDEKYVGKLFIQDGKLVANKMLVTVEEENWLNDVGINSAYKTDIGKMEIVPSTTEWINGNVELEISYTKEIPEGYVIEYKINNEEWQQGTQITVEENDTKVTARLYSKEKDNEALSNSYTVANIDKVAPDITNMKIDITTGTNSITAVANGATDTLSGIEKYQYSIDNVTWQDSGTFSGYKNATEVTVYAKVIDRVGNESASISDKGTTTAITAPTVNLVNDEWTKDDVIASVTGTAPEGYELQYKLSGGMTLGWITYTGNVTITTNNTTMVARYYNSDVDDEIASASKTAAKIDKFAPDITNMKIDITTGTNSITAVASGATDTLSGNVTYKYSLDNSIWQTSGTFSGIKSGTEATIYAKAIDKVGNESASISNKGTTTAITGSITLTPNIKVTTGSDVIVTLSYSGTIPSGYVMQYKLSGGMTKSWTTGSSVTVTTNNTTVSGRLYHSASNDEILVNSYIVSNIDKDPPIITTSFTSNSTSATVTITSDVENKYALYNYEPSCLYMETGGYFVDDSSLRSDVSSTEPGPITNSVTWKLIKDGTKEIWNGFQGTYGNFFDFNSGDYLVLSGYYKTSSNAGITSLDCGNMYRGFSDWTKYNSTYIYTSTDIVTDGKWHYFCAIMRLNEAVTDGLVGHAPSWGYSTQSGTLYLNGINWRIIPSTNTTALDIHKVKYAKGIQTVDYFKNGGGTYVNGNKFTVNEGGTYTVYAEDLYGNAAVKTINITGI